MSIIQKEMIIKMMFWTINLLFYEMIIYEICLAEFDLRNFKILLDLRSIRILIDFII